MARSFPLAGLFLFSMALAFCVAQYACLAVECTNKGRSCNYDINGDGKTCCKSASSILDAGAVVVDGDYYVSEPAKFCGAAFTTVVTDCDTAITGVGSPCGTPADPSCS